MIIQFCNPTEIFHTELAIKTKVYSSTEMVWHSKV